MSQNFDVVAICNALMDVIYEISNEELQQFNLTKGQMHLVDEARQRTMLAFFKDRKEVGREIGGSSLNVIRALALLEKKTAFAGSVADDPFGAAITKRMAELKIDSKIIISSNESTGVCLVLVSPDHERTMVTYLGASRLYGTKLVPTAAIQSSRVLHFCGYQWDTDGQKAAIAKGIEEAKHASCLVSFDLADPFVVRQHQSDFQEIVAKKADIVFANEEEAHLLYGLTPEATAAKIASYGPIAVIKLGAKGALIQKGQQQTVVSPVPTQVVDTTGAGDMFAAGFLYGLVSEKSMAFCGRAAATLASDVISHYGAKLSPEVIQKVRSLI